MTDDLVRAIRWGMIDKETVLKADLSNEERSIIAETEPCKHTGEPTGEWRRIGCKDGANSVARPVRYCPDCSAYWVDRGGEHLTVPPPPPFEEIKRQVHQGHLSRETALAMFGNLSEPERAEIGETVVCDHHRKRTRVTIYDCPDCGRTIQEEVNTDG